ncbi:histidine--tRNA ligase [Aliifodinibius salipaludis]|uniref:Histidine--tRNA ligase n=1 Tax=Fodinibius salipaludis TaxID=2032627 RepID=A0A2A2G874_9BACT|nr:histidine--tRNA ligase [Aliifodinibius salipaludis]PAU93037.1 histidine--tRNA ligase [Aliifodinibius salipaludis]
MAQPTFSTHVGMVDILPDEVGKWQALERIIHEEAKKFNFEEIRTPIMEQTELIARGVGQLTDIVSKEMFAFERGDDQYVLRPECTAPVARAFVEHHLEQRGGTQNLYYIGPMFRAEKPQKGRQRQFHQFGAEIIGADDPAADVDIITLMMSIYDRVGISNTSLKINSVGDPASRKAYTKALKDYFRPHLDEMSDISRERFEKNPLRILDSKEEEDQPFIENAPVITDFLTEETEAHYARVKELLKELEIPFEEDPYLVRGLDYYTRTAFELISPDLGAQDALGGGGRYDLLIEEVGGQHTPAVGFAAGMERLFIACDELDINLVEEEMLDVYIVTLGDEARKWGINHLPKLRKAGLSASMDYIGRSIKAQMKDADRENARHVIIVGGNELAEGKFTLRNMKASEEDSYSFDEILNKLTN